MARTEDNEPTSAALDALGARWSADSDLGQVSVVGAGMKSHPGVAATTFATLEANGIEPVIVTTYSIKIACHVRKSEVGDAVRALHQAFGPSQAPEGSRD